MLVIIIQYVWLEMSKLVWRKTHIFLNNKFVESEFLKDLSYAPFNKVEYVEDPNDALKIWYNLFNEILNKHAPIVTRRVKRNLYNNLNGIIQKFSMPDKWEINLKNLICGLNINSGEIEQSKY